MRARLTVKPAVGQHVYAIILASGGPPTQQNRNIGSLVDALEIGLDGDDLSVLRCLRERALSQSHSQSHPVYVVGGPVRDALMGLPIKDLDFVVEGDGPELAKWLAGQLGGTVRVHSRFGTAALIIGRCRVDVVTARRETYARPAALPQVTPGTISDDLSRRDFSINALALPLFEMRPEVMDPHGGVDDIGRRVIRILHSNSFVDDPTRIFRAVRYEQRLGFELEPGTLGCLAAAMAQGHIGSLTGDRIRHELEKMFEEDQPVLALKRSAALGVLEAVHPGLGRSEAVERLTDLTSGSEIPGKCDSNEAGPLAYLAALAYPLSEVQAEELIRRVNAPGAWSRVIRDVVSLKSREEDLVAAGMSGSRLADSLKEFCAEALWAVARVTKSQVVTTRLALYSDQLRDIGPALTGKDLLDMGIAEGPGLGRLLRQLREAKLDGTVTTENDERRLVQEHIDGAEQSNPTAP
ncbi:MAG: hypothetical protein BZY75_02175 [SAR202 cluster bacterium Io17-Chloro-G7]|nr:MAG: hypothetical protein BZY75_02175 [SAR202 cluster bacterium Io17-Chloro-G7]